MTARDWTTIKVLRTTKDGLDAARLPGKPETYDQIVARLIREGHDKRRLKW